MIRLMIPPLLLFSFAAAEPIAVDGKHQLFLDDYLIESMQNVQRLVQQAEKYAGNPVLWATESWEDKVAVIYGSVIRDADKYKCWYKSGQGVAYAESEDGIKWVRPPLDLVEEDGRHTNILFRKKGKREGPEGFPYFYELFGVHKDERETDPSRRYKMGFLDIDWKHTGEGGDPFHPGQRRGLGVAGSPDGIHWTLIDNWATEAICDGATHWMFDPVRNKYVLCGRTRKTLPEVEAAWSKYDWYKEWHGGRAVARIESSDFLHWDFTKPATAPVVMTTDLGDPPGIEIYSMKVFPYEGIYVGLVQVFHALPDVATLDIQLAVSHDSVHFTRVGDRSPFIPLGGAGEWDRFNHSIGNNGPLSVGEDLRFYYGSRLYRHTPYKGKDTGSTRGGMGFATIRKDRFVALQSSFDGGEILTKPLVLKGQSLHINAKSNFGSITIDVVNADGTTGAESKPIQQDGTDILVEWKKGSLPQDQSLIRLRIKLANARLYSLWTS